MKAVDLFAGAGGFSTGAAMAGCNVVYAANHWPVAVAIHSANHPGEEHVCQDVQQVTGRWCHHMTCCWRRLHVRGIVGHAEMR